MSIYNKNNRLYKEVVKIKITDYLNDPLPLLGVKAALSRLAGHHFAYSLLKTKCLNLEAGLDGENRVNSVLQNYPFPMEHQVFHDLSLKSSQLFQMDHLFQTSSYSIIFETKNISGKLRFQENPKQLIRIKADGGMDAFECPAAQVRRKCELLKDWFQTRNMDIPVLYTAQLS